MEQRNYLLRLARSPELAARAQAGPPHPGFRSEADWARCVKENYAKFIPFLMRECELQFRGRLLEIGAGTAWFSAELSKLPRVVEIIVTDYSPERLQKHVPRSLRLLKANEGKITRIPADIHKLEFPDNHFDFVVCSAVLHRTVSLLEALRETRRVLKPGGQFVAIREPVWPLVKWSRRAAALSKRRAGRESEPRYTLAEYRDHFDRARLELTTRRVNLASGLKYYLDQVVHGITHARYVLVATKRGRS